MPGVKVAAAVNEESAPIILAIDPGTQRAGWCAAQGDRYLNSGTLGLGKGDAWQRLARFALELRGLLERFDPDVIACELPMGHHRNLATDRKLGAAFGVVLALAALNGVEFMVVHPMAVKATGYGKDNLAHTGLLIGKALGGRDGDEGDAVGVWQAALVGLQERALTKCDLRENE